MQTSSVAACLHCLKHPTILMQLDSLFPSGCCGSGISFNLFQIISFPLLTFRILKKQLRQIQMVMGKGRLQGNGGDEDGAVPFGSNMLK